jgi:stringent starvation protein B
MKMLLSLDRVKFACLNECLDIICAKGHTAYLAIDSNHSGYEGPRGDAPNGIVILSLGVNAITLFHMEESHVTFGFTIGGVKDIAYIPMSSIVSIMAKEDPTIFQGFPSELEMAQESTDTGEAPKAPKGFSPKIIKGGKV